MKTVTNKNLKSYNKQLDKTNTFYDSINLSYDTSILHFFKAISCLPNVLFLVVPWWPTTEQPQRQSSFCPLFRHIKAACNTQLPGAHLLVKVQQDRKVNYCSRKVSALNLVFITHDDKKLPEYCNGSHRMAIRHRKA
jgi:hypothetical protein